MSLPSFAVCGAKDNIRAPHRTRSPHGTLDEAGAPGLVSSPDPRTPVSVSDHKIGVLFVCLGNICRSPLAEALFREAVREEGLADRFRIDSAGTSGYHDGEPPDARTTATAQRRGVTVGGVSRRVTAADVDAFDYLVVMDADNLREVRRLTGGREAPTVVRLREFDPQASGDLDVPDPYFGGPDGFDRVHDIVERSARGLLAHIRREQGL